MNDITLTTTNKPFFVRSYYRSNSHQGEWNTGISTNNHAAMVVGIDAGYGDVNEGGSHNLWDVMAYPNADGNWWVRHESPTHSNYPDWYVHVLFIRHDFVDDQRTGWGAWN